MLQVLRQRNFLILWTAGLVSLTGDWVLIAALPIYVYTLTHSALATSISAAASMLPSLLLGSVAGVYVDRWPRKWILLITNILLAITLLPLLLVHSAGLVWIVYLVSFVQSIFRQFFYPAEAAVLPTLVGEELLVTANSLSSLNRNIARLIGPALGGLIAISTGLTGVTLIDAASFAIAAALVALLVMPRQAVPAPSEEAAGSSSIWRELVEGLRLLRDGSDLGIFITIFTLTSVGEGVFGTMFVIWVKQVLHGSALQFGWFMSAQAVGGILGGLAIGAISSRIGPKRLAWIGCACFALLDMTLFSYPLLRREVWIGLVVMVLVGIPAAAGGSSMLSLLQLATPDAYRGRIFGVLGTTSSLAMLAGTFIAGTFGGIVGPIALLNAFQGGTYLVAAFVFLLLSRRLPPAATATEQPGVTSALG